MKKNSKKSTQSTQEVSWDKQTQVLIQYMDSKFASMESKFSMVMGSLAGVHEHRIRYLEVNLN